jgi:tRNA(Ile)-lysidine synthase
MLSSGEGVLVAVSGGADSVGLLAVLAQIGPRLGVELVAAHVHHGLRGADADADEACAAAAAKELQVPFVRSALGRQLRRGGNIEGRARQLRYRALHELARENGCTKVATGHTHDDQAETFLLRLVRGSGPRGLSAILPTRSDGVIRPLLESGRSEVEAVVRSLGLEYRTDHSNLDPRFLRTHVRHRVLPLLAELNPAIVETLARTAEMQRIQNEILASWTAGELERVARENTLDVTAVRALPMGWASYVVRRWLEGSDGASRQLAAVHVDAVVELARSSRASGRLTLPGGLRVRRRGSHLLIGEAAKSTPAEPRVLKPGDELQLPGGWRLAAALSGGEAPGLTLPADLWSAVCACPSTEPELQVRVARRGERVQPLGMCGRKKLSDLFIDHKIPLEERADYPVIEHAGAVVWVPGVVRTEALRVDAGTRQIMRLRAEQLCTKTQGDW